VAVTPDYSEVAKLADLWMHPKQGTDAAVAMAMGHVILKEFYFDRRSKYFDNYARHYTDLPLLVMLKEHTTGAGEKIMVPDRYVRASDFDGKFNQANNPEWKTVAFDEAGKVVLPNGSIGFRWGAEGRADEGKWNLEAREAVAGSEVKLKLSLLEGAPSEPNTAQVGLRETLVATVFDLQVANYGVARGLPGEQAASGYDDDIPYTPAWQERITGVPRDQIITVARQFADNADKTQGKSMVIIGAAMNHWYHSDMNYRGVINMLMLCGCIGQSGGGWAHYVGQEKLRPQTGWTALAFALDWIRPPRQMNSHQLLLRPHRPVALRKARHGRGALAAGRQGKYARQHDRLQRARRAHGLAAFGAATADAIRCRWCATRRRPAWRPGTMPSRRSRMAR
jgi:nitrate reductase alpha subunit